MEKKKDTINVAIRIKPNFGGDSETSTLKIISNEPPVVVVVDRSQLYHFDNIFSDDIDQEHLYNNTVRSLVDHVKQGYNCTVFTYGQTGTGKTYTMGTEFQESMNPDDLGIIPRALEQIFQDSCNINVEETVDISISFLEIYNEKCFDLLESEKNVPLQVAGFAVAGLNKITITNDEEAKFLVQSGNKRRHTGETRENVNSSRSHAIFTIYFTCKNHIKEITGKLNLVDLAGSERVKKTGCRGSTFQEAININKGLLSIGQVISALSMNSNHIPYRQSMITSILQNSLNTDSYTCLIACVSPKAADITETLQTLDFAQRAKKIRSNPEIHQIIAKYKKEHLKKTSTWRTPLKTANTTHQIVQTPSTVNRLTTANSIAIIENIDSNSDANSTRNQFVQSISPPVIQRACPELSQQQILSPLIRKHVAKMEASLINRLETVLKNTVAQTTNNLTVERENNTPRLLWSKIEQELPKLVRNELIQFTVDRRNIVTSSPIVNDDARAKTKRKLRYDVETSFPVIENDFNFKVPPIPKLPKNKLSLNQSLSPINGRSIKLLCNRQIHADDNVEYSNFNHDQDCSAIDSNRNLSVRAATVINKLPRRSARLSSKIIANNNSTMHALQSQMASNVTGPSEKTAKDIECQQSKNCGAVRRSIRIANKENIDKRQDVTCVCRAKKTKRKENSKKSNIDSPFTSHSKKVLNILNKGTIKDLQRLHSVGIKTSEQILLYRNLKGNFENFDDLSKLPGWGTKKCRTFSESNFLIRE